MRASEYILNNSLLWNLESAKFTEMVWMFIQSDLKWLWTINSSAKCLLWLSPRVLFPYVYITGNVFATTFIVHDGCENECSFIPLSHFVCNNYSGCSMLNFCFSAFWPLLYSEKQKEQSKVGRRWGEQGAGNGVGSSCRSSYNGLSLVGTTADQRNHWPEEPLCPIDCECHKEGNWPIFNFGVT